MSDIMEALRRRAELWQQMQDADRIPAQIVKYLSSLAGRQIKPGEKFNDVIAEIRARHSGVR